MIKGVSLEPNYGVIIFNDYQLYDIERFCCSGMTPLGFDKTYKLGNIFLTGSVYKHLAVKSSETGETPIFLGPMYLHTKSTFSDFHPFFSCLASKLKDVNTDQLIISSDDEQALVKAIHFNFPNAKHFLCSRHLRGKHSIIFHHFPPFSHFPPYSIIFNHFPSFSNLPPYSTIFNHFPPFSNFPPLSTIFHYI